MKKQRTILLIDYLEIIVKWRKSVILNILTLTILAAIISLLLPQKFIATATILPPSSQQETMLGMISANIPSGLAGLSGVGGILPGISTPSDLFAAIMKSGRIKSTIIKKHDLKKKFKTKRMIDASKMLDEMTAIEIRPEGIIAVSITYKDKYLAADIANSYIEELDKFNTETAMTVGKKYRIFIEQRLRETTDTLAKAEETLRQFQEKHRTVALDVEIASAIATIAEIKKQILLLEVKKGAISSATRTDNPYLYNINRELRELKKQLSKIELGDGKKNGSEFGAGFSVPFSKLPEVSLEYARLYRDVEVQQVIFEVLNQQYEQAKIMELKDTPTVQVLDRAGPPEERSFPKRKKIVAIAFVFSLFTGIGLAFLLNCIEKIKEKEEGMEWRKIGKIIKNDFDVLKRKIKRFKIRKGPP